MCGRSPHHPVCKATRARAQVWFALRSRALARSRAASRLGLPDYCRFWARWVRVYVDGAHEPAGGATGLPEPDAQRTPQQTLAEMRPARGCNTTASAQAGRSGQGRGVNEQQTAATALQQPSSPPAGGVQEVRAGRCAHLPAHQPSAISHGVARRCHACHRTDSMRHHPPPPRALHPPRSAAPDTARRGVDHWSGLHHVLHLQRRQRGR